MQVEKIRIASEEVRSNYIKTLILLGLLFGCAFALSMFIGYLFDDNDLGILIGVIVCAVVIPLELLCAKFAIIHMTGCVKADPNDLKERRIIQMVEGLSMSAGLVKTPDVYIMKTSVPNAFAAGWSPDSSMVAVTRGLADMMDEQELEGVIAHEVAHIVHRDVMLCQLAVAVQTALLVLAEIVQWIGYFAAIFAGRSSDDDDKKSGNVIAGLLIYLLIKPITWLVSTLIVMAISRKREYAADAFAVRLCSYNEGLASALEKLSGERSYYREREVSALGGSSVAPMYFYYPVQTLFSTHPDTEERIRRLRNMY